MYYKRKEALKKIVKKSTPEKPMAMSKKKKKY